MKAFCADTRGATAIEYAMIAAFVSIIIIGTVNTLGSNLNTLFYSRIATMLSP